MIHEMSLNAQPYEQIKNKGKIIEVRLYDEKRRTVHHNDIIIFSKLPDKEEKMAVEVIELLVFPSFKELFSNFEKSKFGHCADETIEEQINRQWEHYTKEEEKKYGVVGMHIKLLEKLSDPYDS